MPVAPAAYAPVDIATPADTLADIDALATAVRAWFLRNAGDFHAWNVHSPAMLVRLMQNAALDVDLERVVVLAAMAWHKQQATLS